jgi:hypothetical protein
MVGSIEVLAVTGTKRSCNHLASFKEYEICSKGVSQYYWKEFSLSDDGRFVPATSKNTNQTKQLPFREAWFD